MDLPSQKISAETLEAEWRREMQRLANARMVKRLWGKDESLWPHANGQKRLVTNNLNWLDLPDQIGPYMMRAAAVIVARVRRSGVSASGVLMRASLTPQARRYAFLIMVGNKK